MARPESDIAADETPARALVLASGSATRAAMLRAAGLDAEVVPPSVDEAGVKASLMQQDAGGEDIARALAELKALRVSRRRPGALVIGADQVLLCNGVMFDKPADLDHARAALLALRGKTHDLVSVACVALDGGVMWHEGGRARLTMRDFTEAFLDGHLAQIGEAATTSVGAYRIEGPGAQLFSRIDGDFLTILGLPLLPLLDFLRGHGILRR